MISREKRENLLNEMKNKKAQRQREVREKERVQVAAKLKERNRIDESVVGREASEEKENKESLKKGRRQ